jgi:hypothetical protein
MLTLHAVLSEARCDSLGARLDRATVLIRMPRAEGKRVWLSIRPPAT